MIFIAAAIRERESPGRIYDNSAVTPSHHLMMKTNDFNWIVPRQSRHSDTVCTRGGRIHNFKYLDAESFRG